MKGWDDAAAANNNIKSHSKATTNFETQSRMTSRLGSSHRNNLDEIKESKSAERRKYKFVANNSEAKNASFLNPNNALSEYFETKTNSTRGSGSFIRPVTGNKYKAPGTIKNNKAMKQISQINCQSH